MKGLRLIFFTVLLILSVPWPLPAQISLDATLTPFLSRYDLPALAAAVVKNGEIQAAGAVGTRRAGTNIPVTINDRFHLGSDTKAMTALLAAGLVEQGKLHWDSNVAAIFPELSKKMDPGLRKVTLEQLLSHTGGLPSDNETFGNLLNGKVKAFLAGPNGDNPAIIGPAGIAHMSILDFARWAGWNAGEGKREPQLVRPETLRKLHTPVISMPEKKEAAPGTPSHGRYALGWGELTVPWAPGPLLYNMAARTA